MGKITFKKNEQRIKEIISKFIDPDKYEIFIFGSRATGHALEYSDCDIGISGKKALPLRKIALIKEALEESELPFRVDIVDFFMVSDNFKKEALLKVKKI